MTENAQLVQMIYRFLAYIKARDGEYVPFSFQGKNTFLGKEENYKARVYSKAQDALRYEKWTESWIKTGKNLSYAHKAMNCAGNLVFKNQQIDFQNRINPENKAYRPDAARVLYKFTKARMVRMRLLPSLNQRKYLVAAMIRLPTCIFSKTSPGFCLSVPETLKGV